MLNFALRAAFELPTGRSSCRFAPLPVIGLLLWSASGAAQAPTPYDQINHDAAVSPIQVEKLRGHVSVLTGSGGNIGVLTGSDGLLMVDTGIAISQDNIRKALGSQPLRYVIDTHWHWDHTDGNAWVRAAGATLIASDEVLARLQQTVRVAEWSHTFTPIAPVSLPNIAINDSMTLSFNGEVVQVRPYRSGHTDGDLSVYFRKADILQTGDTWWNGFYPFIDYATGGSIDGAIAAADANLAMAGKHTIIIPGHGPIGTRADLLEFREMLAGVRANVEAMKAKGMSVEQVIAARPTSDYDAKWGTGLIDAALFSALVYRGV